MTIHPNPELQKARLLEVSWEVCNQLGGIYTVIRSKLPATMAKWGDRYTMIGPLMFEGTSAEFEPSESPGDAIGRAVDRMRGLGHEVLMGRWLVTGRPRVVLLKPSAVFDHLQDIKSALRDPYGIDAREGDQLYDDALLWGEMVKRFLIIVDEERRKDEPLIAHFHEWMSASPILGLASMDTGIRTVFTTHATMLGRVLAMHDVDFYEKIDQYDDQAEARRFALGGIHGIEKQAAKHADVFTTVSRITALECEHLLGVKPHRITPNGLNIARFAANHEVQLKHATYKEKIHEFVMGHFFNCYSFDLDNTLYLFTSGRYEYRNKGYDITVDALKMLNQMMIEAGLDVTVVMFIITKREIYSINPDVMERRAVLEEIRKNTESISKDVREKLFLAAAASRDDYKLPDLNKFVPDYWKLRYRRTLQSWKTKKWPIVVTHNLVDDAGDEVLNALRGAPLINSPLDKVKVVYHPDFISSTSPLFGMDYGQFVRGCHLGIFPSYYEPWGYTPLECIARGVPAVTSDLSGFGRYVNEHRKSKEETGVHVVRRQHKTRAESTQELADFLFRFARTTTRYRTILRNQLEDYSENFDWRLLTLEYDEAYMLAAG